MKKISILLSGIALLASVSSCSDNDYDSRYDNPSQTTTASCDKLFTGVLVAGKDFTLQKYWRMYTWENMAGKYSQTIGSAISDGSQYSQNDSYANNRWENFYNVLTQYRVLQDVYEKEDEAGKSRDKIFLNLSEVFVYFHLSQIIDIWGDVPYSEAGYLGLTGDVKGSYPAYDSDTELYTMMLNRLGELSNELTSMKGNLSPIAAAALPAQDFLIKGDVDGWIRFTNALRLRLAVRVATQGELSSLGKTVVAEILNGNKSLPTTHAEGFFFQGDDGSTDEFNFSNDIRDGYKDINRRASAPMLKTLLTEETLGENDPRLPIMYSKNAAGGYRGLALDDDQAEQSANLGLPEAQRAYSAIDSTTFIYNAYMLQPIITTAEVDFLKAEAYQRGWAGGDAKASFVNGMAHAIEYLFACNAASIDASGHKATEEEIPTEAEAKAYAEKVWDHADNKLEAIIHQKWFNFGVFQMFEAWNEVRRTGYPELYFRDDNNAQQIKTVPNRVRYPGSERNNNVDNYNAQVQTMPNGDDYYTKIFWAK